MKKISKVLVLVSLLFLVAPLAWSAGSNESEDGVMTIKLGHNNLDDTARGIAANTFKEVLERETGGKVIVEVYPNNALGSEAEMIESVKIGAQDMQIMGHSALATTVPEFAIMGMPFLFNNLEEAEALLASDIAAKWNQKAQEHGYKVLGYVYDGFAQITSNKVPVNSLEDLAKLKMRSPNDENLIKTFKALGAAVTTLPFSELYMGLSQGVVDGQFNPIIPVLALKFDEVQDYLSVVNIFYYNADILINNDLWNSLSDELKEKFMLAAKAAGVAGTSFVTGNEASAMDDARARFKEVVFPDTAPFREKVASVYDELAERIPAVADAVEFMEQYRAGK